VARGLVLSEGCGVGRMVDFVTGGMKKGRSFYFYSFSLSCFNLKKSLEISRLTLLRIAMESEGYMLLKRVSFQLLKSIGLNNGSGMLSTWFLTDYFKST